MLKVYFLKSPEKASLPWVLIVSNQCSIISSESTGHDSILTFIQIDLEICEKINTDFVVVVVVFCDLE